MKHFNGHGNQNVRSMRPQQPQPQQIQVNVEGETPTACACGCVYFVPAVMVYKISALVSPTGQELTAQRAVLVCMDCKAVLGQEKAQG